MAAAVRGRPCCQTDSQTDLLGDRLFSFLEKVSAVALGVFSAYTSMKLFLPFFLAGVAIGLYQRYSSGGDGETPRGVSACSQGFMEQLTKVKLPPIVSLGINLAITWVHIEHHTAIFVPVVALSSGAWAGVSAGEFVSSLRA